MTADLAKDHRNCFERNKFVAGITGHVYYFFWPKRYDGIVMTLGDIEREYVKCPKLLRYNAVFKLTNFGIESELVDNIQKWKVEPMSHLLCPSSIALNDYLIEKVTRKPGLVKIVAP